MTDNEIKMRRAKLMVEAFLLDLHPANVAEVESDNLKFSFIVTFKLANNSLKFIAIEVKHTDDEVFESFHFLANPKDIRAFKSSNMPTVIFVANTKDNKLYYGYAVDLAIVQNAYRAHISEVSIPVEVVKYGKSKEFVCKLIEKCFP